MKKILLSFSILLCSLSFSKTMAEYKREITVIEEKLALSQAESQGQISADRYKELREAYDSAYKLLVAIAADDTLSQESKVKTLELAADIISEGLEKITQPYADVKMADRVSLGDNHFFGKDTAESVLSKISYLLIATGRDLSSVARPQFWRDRRLSKFLKSTAQDFSLQYDTNFDAAAKAEGEQRGQYSDQLAGLYNLLQKIAEKDVEPARYGVYHRSMMRFYLFMGWVYWYVGPTFDIAGFLNWNTRTKVTGLITVGIMGVLGTTLAYIRNINGGAAFYRITQRVMRKDEEARKHGTLKAVSSTCAALLKRIGKSDSRWW